MICHHGVRCHQRGNRMKLINMKQSAEMKSALASQPSDDTSYPYGLKIYLEEDQIKKLGINGLPPVDSDITLSAKGCICGVSENEAGNGTRRSITIQLTDMAVSKPTKDTADELYGENE